MGSETCTPTILTRSTVPALNTNGKTQLDTCIEDTYTFEYYREGQGTNWHSKCRAEADTGMQQGGG